MTNLPETDTPRALNFKGAVLLSLPKAVLYILRGCTPPAASKCLEQVVLRPQSRAEAAVASTTEDDASPHILN